MEINNDQVDEYLIDNVKILDSTKINIKILY